jgi:hypothetical protein
MDVSLDRQMYGGFGSSELSVRKFVLQLDVPQGEGGGGGHSRMITHSSGSSPPGKN